MVAQARDSTTLNQPQSQQPHPAPVPVAVSAEDEALKGNTDCVYFLASPLTCKKGNECEYRHSEYARMNPRDCYYWLNGNCLNPKCAFRHPPLDGLLGTQGAASSAPSFSTSQTAAAINATYKPRTQVAAINAPYYPGNQLAGTSAAYNPGKQAVPCVFFQNGQCAKGERCSFSHGLNPATNKVVHAPAATPVTEPSVLKKEFSGLKKCGQEQQKFPQVNLSKPTEVSTILKPAAVSKHTTLSQKNVQTPMRFNDEISSDTERNVPPVTDRNTVIWSNHTLQNEVSDDHSLQNGNDADELYRESSPGFDVLVEDELRNSDYYNKDDHFGSRIHEGRILNDYDVDRSAMVDVDRETFHGPRDYDSYDRMQGQYDWKHHRASSERRAMGSDHMERRGYRKGESPERINGSDLRHRLSKKRANGLRSVISHDYNNDEERSYRDSRKDTRHESSFGGRLRGRINISGRSPPVEDDIRFSERDLDRGRMTFSSSHQGRLQNRLKGRVQDDFDNDHGNFRPRRDMMTDTRTDFSGPKRLAELKVSKGDESKEQDLFLREKSKSMNREGRHQSSDCDLSFEGPKPLSEILKRKRGVETSVSDNMDENPKQKTIRSSITWASEKEGTKAHDDSKVEMDGVNPIQKSEYGQSSQVANEDTELEAEEGMIEDEGLEDHELEAYDQGNEELDYDQADGGDYTLDEGDNADLEEEYLEDEEEDADDFAKKIGVMFS